MAFIADDLLIHPQNLDATKFLDTMKSTAPDKSGGVIDWLFGSGALKGEKGRTAEEYFKDLKASFVQITEDTLTGRNGMEGMFKQLEKGYENFKNGKGFDKANLKTQRTALIDKVKEQRSWLDNIVTALDLSGHQPVDEIMKIQESLLGEVRSIRDGTVKTGSSTIKLDEVDKAGTVTAAANYEIQGIDAANAKLYEVVKESGKADELVMKVANLDKIGEIKKISIGTLDSGTGAFKAHAHLDNAIREIDKVTGKMLAAPDDFVKSIENSVKKAEAKVSEYEKAIDKVGVEVLGEKAVFAEKVAASAGKGMKSSEVVEDMFKGLARNSDGGELLKAVGGQHITEESKALGVVGKEAGMMDAFMANLKVAENKLVTHANGEQVVEAVAHGGGRLALNVGVEAVKVGAIGWGLNKMFGSKKDDNGQEVEKNSSDTALGVLGVGAGIAGLLMSITNKGKALGKVL